MQAVTVALGAASLVGVPLMLGIWFVRRKGEREHRRIAAGARGRSTKIVLVGDEAKAESEAPRRRSRKRRRTKREVIDLFGTKEPPATGE